MIHKKTTDLESTSTQCKERETDVSSATLGTPINANGDESATNVNLNNLIKELRNSSKVILCLLYQSLF